MKVTDSQLVFNGRAIKVYRDEVTLDNGMDVVREVVRHSGAAAVVPMTEDGKILMVRQHRYAVDAEMLEIPAGCTEEGESRYDCAMRETEEEIGFKPGKLQHLFDFMVSPGYNTERVGIYLASDLIPSKQNLDPDEFITVEARTLSELVEMVRVGEIVDGKTIAAVMCLYGLYLKYGNLTKLEESGWSEV